MDVSVLVLILSVLVTAGVVLWYGPKDVTHREGSWPRVGLMLVRALMGLVMKPRRLNPDIKEMPHLKICVSNVFIDAARLKGFLKLVDAEQSEQDDVPLMYFIVEAICLDMFILSHPRFPVSAMGAVLLKHTSEAFQKCDSSTGLTFACELQPEIRRRETGNVEVDMVNKAWREDGILVWKGTTTMVLIKPDRKRKRRTHAVLYPKAVGEVMGTMQLNADVGRLYSRLSGDINPIHLWPWSAKLFGFRRPIAHGLFLMALSHAKLHSTSDRYPQMMFSEFLRPTLLPANLQLLKQTHDVHGSTIKQSFTLITQEMSKPVALGHLTSNHIS